jgi:Protein of unknown function (DUF1194)
LIEFGGATRSNPRLPLADENERKESQIKMAFWGKASGSFIVLMGCLVDPVSASDVPVDLQLVLAVDISSSMSLAERKVQRDGYIAALRDPVVIDAIRAGPTGGIAITYVEWADYQIQAVPWTLVDGPESAEEFAERISYLPFHRESTTSISGALSYSADLFAHSGFTSERKTIDISGDGPNNAGLPVLSVRDTVIAQGISINGLPIMLREDLTLEGSNLEAYFRDCVIGGPAAFAMRVSKLDQLAETIKLKLLAEILIAAKPTPPTILQMSDTRPRQPTDCMAGEKTRHTVR